MASHTTHLTELGTAVGLAFDPDRGWPAGLLECDVPGLDALVWRPVLEPVALGPHGASRDLLLRALHNGRAFRTSVLGGRPPRSVRWDGGSKAVWNSDVPRDITVDGVYFLQAKYDSTCVLNTAPGSLVDELLANPDAPTRPSWYEEVAPRELMAYYREVRLRPNLPTLPNELHRLNTEDRRVLKNVMRANDAGVAGPEAEAYATLCQAVSIETAVRWRHRLERASRSQHTQMLFRMLRISGGPYWLLGTKGKEPVRLAVADTRTWRDLFELRQFTVRAGQRGQPVVDWRAEVADRLNPGLIRTIDGYCELRWSHGKLQGNPECKVQVRTPLGDLPGYTPMA